MSLQTTDLTEVLKNAQTATSLLGLWSLFANSSGEPQKAILMKEATVGSSIVSGNGVWIVVVYSKDDPWNANISIAIRKPETMVLHTIFSHNLNLICNQYGTVALASDSPVANPVFVVMCLSMGSV